MSAKGLLGLLTSLRTTVVLLCALAVLLLLNVVLPQEKVLGEQRFATLIEQDPVAGFFLDTLGLGRMAVSPVFLTLLALFFLNLMAVLATRVGPTWRRAGLSARSEEGLQAWIAKGKSRSAPLPEGWSMGAVVETLRGFGYQTRRVGERTVWGVKHRTAPLGFVVFHLSFFLLFVGGMLLYTTRFVGTAVLAEGQEFNGEYAQVVRSPRIGQPPQVNFRVERIDPRFVEGLPLHLEATIRVRRGAHTEELSSRVNHPAKWGTTSVLVERAGLAPAFWLQDARGFTLDRVVVASKTLGDDPSLAPLADETFQVLVAPLAPDEPFPVRDELARAGVTVSLFEGEELLFEERLRPGEAASWGGGRLVLEELRYWVGVRVISERGGGWLITGFLLAVVGLVWRLLWYRREVAVTWDEEQVRLIGHSEYYGWRFREELESMFTMIAAGGPAGPADREESEPSNPENRS